MVSGGFRTYEEVCGTVSESSGFCRLPCRKRKLQLLPAAFTKRVRLEPSLIAAFNAVFSKSKDHANISDYGKLLKALAPAVCTILHPSPLTYALCPRGLTSALAIFSLCLAIGTCDAQAAESDAFAEIVLGMSAVLSGSASNPGKDIQRGVLVGLERANRSGGVNGRVPP